MTISNGDAGDTSEMNWDEFGKYVADKKLDFLQQEGQDMIVTEEFGYDDIPEEEKERRFLHDSLYYVLCIMKILSQSTGVKTFKLTERDLEIVGSIPYFINEMPNGDIYITLEDK